MRSTKQKVLVIGLLGSQEQRIARDFGHKYDLRFFRAAKRTSGLRKKMQNCDRVMAMTSFINHNISEIVDRHAGYVPIGGSVSSLRQQLEGI